MTQHTNNTPIVVPLNISRAPMSAALTWFKNALLLIKAQPLVMLLTSSWIVFTNIFLSGLIPAVGTVIFLIITPALAFGMADLCQKVRLQEPASPLSIFSPLFYSIRTRLLSLGILFAAILFGLFILGQTIVDQGAIGEIFNKMIALQNLDDIDEIRKQSRELLSTIVHDKRIIASFAMMFVGSALVQVLLMYAPMFSVWQNAEAPMAIWMSIRTVLINSLPIAFALLLIAVTIGALAALITILGIFIPAIIMFATMAGLIVFNTLVNAMTYTSYYSIIRSSLTNSVKASIDQIIENEASEKTDENGK